jgi:thiosulfate reductase cytochrome b subunit
VREDNTMAATRILLFARFERFWHWSQAVLVITLLVTGFQVHGYLGGWDFRTALLVHGYCAWALVTLWIFAIFWHFTTGEWRQYIPTSRMVAAVARHYAWGMFRGEPHPFHKTREHKHNPLQRLAYLWLKAMVNPLVWVSGAVLLVASYNWLPVLPFGLPLAWVAWAHTAAAYMMLLFLVAHLYLTTTGHTPLAYIRSMITGWEIVEDAGAKDRPPGEPIP